jgi:phosphoribosyl-AMP cyclohydrolase
VTGDKPSNLEYARLTGSPVGRFFLPVVSPMDFSKLQGLVPAVIQDAESGEVLMVGFMNEEALALTRQTGFATFYSRTRNKLWMKGETSGNRLQVTELLTDCDDDTVLLKVKRLGDGNVCHTGERTCFIKPAA